MINAHQVHDVYPSIRGKSIFRMLLKPIVDYVPHIQSISKISINKMMKNWMKGKKNNKTKLTIYRILVGWS